MVLLSAIKAYAELNNYYERKIVAMKVHQLSLRASPIVIIHKVSECEILTMKKHLSF